MPRIGVFVCHCGLNIASTVDVDRVVEALRGYPGVALAADYQYMCSDPGQALIQDAIQDHQLDSVVVAACSPTMHESTFRRAADAAGLNPYRLEIANIREQIAWPHQRAPEEATRKAIETVRTLVEKVRRNESMTPLTLSITRRALIIGGGIAGLTAALDIAEAGYPVVLVERSERLGGKVAQLSPLYLTFDAGDHLLAERIEAVTRHPLIEVFTSAEASGFEGYVGNFTVEISKSAGRKPGRPVNHHPHQSTDLPASQPTARDVGAVILATGYDLYPKARFPEYGGDRLPDVVDSLAFERMLKSGDIRRPSDGRVPAEIVWIQCVGSRAPDRHQPYCSKVCCMCTAKQTIAYRKAVPHGQAYVFYIDIRSQGRGYDEFVQHGMEKFGVVYLRGKASKVVERDGRLEVWGADTLTGRSTRVAADLVVLMMASVPSEGSDELARLLRVGSDESGFFSEAHPKLRPVESLTAGVYLAGACQFPKDIPETVAQASGAASKVLKLFAQPELASEPSVAIVDERLCVGCGLCVPACPYDARELHPWKQVATVNAALCQGCGACAVVCRNKASTVRNMTTAQILAMMEAVL
jgi:heterodisulfide reductase subunit A